MDEKDWQEAVKMYLENRSLKEIQERFDMDKGKIPKLKIRALEERTDNIDKIIESTDSSQSQRLSD